MSWILFGVKVSVNIFLRLFNFHFVALEVDKQCIPKNKRGNNVLENVGIQSNLSLLRKYEIQRVVCKVKNHCKLEFILSFFISLSLLFTHTLPIMQMTCNSKNELRKKTSIVVVYASVWHAGYQTDYIIDSNPLLVESIEIVWPASNISGQSLTIREQKWTVFLQRVYGLLVEHWWK